MTAIIMDDEDESQKSVGAYQYRRGPIPAWTSSRKRCAGKMPLGPLSPLIWNSNGKNAEK